MRPLHLQALASAAHVLTEEEFDVTLPSLPFQWSGSVAAVMRRVVKHMQVTDPETDISMDAETDINARCVLRAVDMYRNMARNQLSVLREETDIHASS